MKKHLHILSLACVAQFSVAQTNSIPNGNFEQWNATTCDVPANYTESSNEQNFFYYGLPCNVKKTTDAYHGTYAVELSTVTSTTDTAFAYFINGNTNDDPSTWSGGMAISQKPKGIRGYYKYNKATVDTGTIIIAFSKAGVNIGTYMFPLGGLQNTYKLFDLTFSPALSVTPDSVIFGAISCKLGNGEPQGVAGSILKLDSLSFTGITVQPTKLNGDFESWTSETFNSVDDWIEDTGSNGGINKTTDAKVGSFAMELITLLGERNDVPRAQASSISTGWYPDNCNNFCNQEGGQPFSNLKDTLAFWYKYTSKGGCNGEVSLRFKKNGNIIFDIFEPLTASATYMYKEIPIDIIGQSPDTVIVGMQSSAWDDTLTTFVGAKLIIDEIHFKSQPLNTSIADYLNQQEITIYPNPSSGIIQLQGLPAGVKNIDVYNIVGSKVAAFSNTKQQVLNQLDLSGYPAGIYFLNISDGVSGFSKKLVIQ